MQTFKVGNKECVALVRKLTPRECLRLMGVDDRDIDRLIEAREVDDAAKQMRNEHTSVKRVLSNSSLYKLAGNSIVVDVLYHIFRKAFVERGNEAIQLGLFDTVNEAPCEYTPNNPLRVVTLCSGYDSQCLALERLKADYPPFDYELIAGSEIDPAACKAHDALFPQWAGRNLGDMTKIDWTKVEDFDLLFYSTPCQSISQAGLQHGFTEGSGTRSSIIWNARDALITKRPRYACLENVAAMVSQKFLPMFNLWQTEIARLGYTNYGKVLNAKDYGVPQNRKRIFLWSVLGDVQYHFPEPMPLTKQLKDILEDEVDTRFYLNPERVQEFVRDNIDKVTQYASEGIGEIEPMPERLKEWVENYEKKSITTDK